MKMVQDSITSQALHPLDIFYSDNQILSIYCDHKIVLLLMKKASYCFVDKLNK